MGIPVIGDLINSVKDLVSEVVVDKDKRDQINLELIKIQDQAQARLDAQVQAQIEVNKIEAASGSVFVAGWRPAIGWVGASGLAYAYIVQPFLSIWVKAPVIDYDGLYNIIFALLGIGAMRTYEKVKGVSTNDYRDVPTRSVEAEKAQKKEEQAEPTPPKKKKRFIF